MTLAPSKYAAKRARRALTTKRVEVLTNKWGEVVGPDYGVERVEDDEGNFRTVRRERVTRRVITVMPLSDD